VTVFLCDFLFILLCLHTNVKPHLCSSAVVVPIKFALFLQGKVIALIRRGGRWTISLRESSKRINPQSVSTQVCPKTPNKFAPYDLRLMLPCGTEKQTDRPTDETQFITLVQVGVPRNKATRTVANRFQNSLFSQGGAKQLKINERTESQGQTSHTREINVH